MRHSRRLSNHPNQPQGPFCTNCQVNLSTFPAYIVCADPGCHNIPICVDCFSVGAADTFPHTPNHPYRVIEKLQQPIYTSDWAAHEEVRLLEALSEHGPHHWKPVADYVGKTQRKSEQHYENVYLKGPSAPFATSSLDDSTPAVSPGASADAMDEPDPVDGKPGAEDDHHTGNKRKLKNNESESESGTLDGFMPLRGDFDVEWDDKAEELISDLSIEPDDTLEERQLKTKLLLMYDERLQRREVVKEFLFDRKLLDFADLKYNDRRGTRDEKELSARLQIFSRLLSKPEFDAFYSSVMTEYRISRDVYRMSQARKAGIRKKNELDIYEVERKARCQRLGDQSKPDGKACAVRKRRRSSAAMDSPAPPATPLSSIPDTPGSTVLSPSKPISPVGNATTDGPSEPNSVQVRKARERKRIAKSPYPVVEATSVEDAEDTWKLSQTEKKLCSALQIPPAEFLRTRDAMLYTASQDVKRRGRPRRRGSKTQVLTIRSRSHNLSKGVAKPNKRQATSKTRDDPLFLDTIPLPSSHNQRLTLRQTSVPPAAYAAPVPKVTLTCKPPNNIAEAPVRMEIEKPPESQHDTTNDKLRLSLKITLPEAQNPSSSAPTSTAITPVSAVGLLESDELPLSTTFTVPPEKQKATQSPAITAVVREDTGKDANIGDRAKSGTTEGKSEEGTKESSEDERLGRIEEGKEDKSEEGKKNNTEDGKEDNSEEQKEDIREQTSRDKREQGTEDTREQTKVDKREEAKEGNLEDTKEDSKEGTRYGTPDSEISCEEDIVHVTALDRTRPITRSFARLSKQMREHVQMNLTRISRSGSCLEGPKRSGGSPGPYQTILNVASLNLERPVTRSFAARMHTTAENADFLTYTPTSESIDEEDEELEVAAKPRVDATRPVPTKKYRVPRKRSHYDRSNASVRDKQGIEAEIEESQLAELSNGENRLLRSSKSPEDDDSSRDEVDEVLCGEDGGGHWSGDVRGPRQIEPGRASEPTNGKKSPDMGSHDLANERHDRRRRNGSDAEELLDHGRASVDSTPDRTPQRLAKKQPKTPSRTSQRLAGKQPAENERAPQRLAKKRPRHLTETDSPRKPHRTASPRRTLEPKDKDRESKETEVTIDGDGECEGKAKEESTNRKARRSDDADSVEILSGGEGDYPESLEKNADQVEEVTLDEGQDDGAEEARDATWTPHESDLGEETHDQSDHDDQKDDVSLENPVCQTEVGTEPGTPDTSLQDGEFQHFAHSKEMEDDRRRTRGRTRSREDLPAVRKSNRVQKRSRRLTESVEAAARSVKRRRTSVRGNRTTDASETPETIPGRCTVITSQVGNASLENTEQLEAEINNVSKRFTPTTPRSKRKSSRQNTPSKSRYATTERRITRSAGRQTRSRSNNLRNRSITDRISLRRG